MDMGTLNSTTDIATNDVVILVNHTKENNSNEPYNIQNNKIMQYNKENKVISYFNSAVKRILDIIAGLIGLVIIIPLTILIYIANWINGDKGPVIFKQKRIGKDGKVFCMLKYRTMVLGADEKLKEYLEMNEESRVEYKIYKKLKNDPRVTKVGKFLRKTSLDEIPQLLNVLNGSMSLVGPRPYLPRELEDMGEYYHIIIKEKPRNNRLVAK